MIGALIMVKNEEKIIQRTIDSLGGYIRHVIVYDTGSTDSTIEMIKKRCKKNKFILHLQVGSFTNFAQTRNESIEFAESVAKNESLKFFILLDAGDEFKCSIPKAHLLQTLQKIPEKISFGIVKKHWLDKTGLIEHRDIRCIRSGKQCRYNLLYPVHETFAGRTLQNMILLDDLFTLYQDRLQCGESSAGRFQKDVQMLENATKTKRNYYYLGQTYMNIHDYENGYKYSVLALETEEPEGTSPFEQMSNYSIILHILNCLIFLKKDHENVFSYFQQALRLNDRLIEAYIYYLKYCIENRLYENAKKYIQILANLEKTVGNECASTNHMHYDYLRWHLISAICIHTGDLEFGKKACERAISYRNNPQDAIQLVLYQNRLRSSTVEEIETRVCDQSTA
jgi:glycosyltransferase involved in cell wall biosynthesis